MSIETATPSAMLPASAQASAAVAILAASLSLARISLMMLLIAGSMVLRSMLPSVLTGTVTLPWRRKSSKSGAILWLLLSRHDHKNAHEWATLDGAPRVNRAVSKERLTRPTAC